jgi:hypothetical protein
MICTKKESLLRKKWKKTWKREIRVTQIQKNWICTKRTRSFLRIRRRVKTTTRRAVRVLSRKVRKLKDRCSQEVQKWLEEVQEELKLNETRPICARTYFYRVPTEQSWKAATYAAVGLVQGFHSRTWTAQENLLRVDWSDRERGVSPPNRARTTERRSQVFASLAEGSLHRSRAGQGEEDSVQGS